LVLWKSFSWRYSIAD